MVAFPSPKDQDAEDTQSGGPSVTDNVYAGSSTSGEDTAKERKRYMQSYLQVVYGLYGLWKMTPQQQQLANKAFSLRQPASSFLAVLRREDPRYTRTEDYKNRMREAEGVYESYRGFGVKVPHGFKDKYARSDMTTERLRMRIQETKWFKQRFPGWKEAANSGVLDPLAPNSAATYLSMRDMLNNNWQRATGKAANPLLHKMMFSAGMNETDIASNLSQLFGGQESLKFMSGQQMDANDILKAALSRKFGGAGLAAVAGARRTQTGFLGSKNVGFDIGVDEISDNLAMPRL